MTLAEALLEQIQKASRDLWRDVGARVSPRLALLAPAGGLWTMGLGWLLGNGGGADLLLQTVAGAGTMLLLTASLSAALALALLDALGALIVTGYLVRTLGDLLLRHEVPLLGPRLEDQFAAFATPHHLSRLTRFRDLPLILFLARMVLSQDAKALLRLAATGVGRQGLIRGLEDQVRGRAAGAIRRLRAAVILLLAVVLSLPQLAAWLFR